MTTPHWLFFPSQEVVLQDTSWTMSDANNASSITSTGLEIVSTTYLGGFLSYANGQPRLWTGAEALNQGGSASGSGGRHTFPSESAHTAYWAQYRLLFSFNGGSFEDGGDPIAGFVGFNLFFSLTTSFSTAGTAFVNGDVLRFKVLAKT